MSGSPSPTGRFGGVRKLEDRLKGRSQVIAHNKEGVAQALIDIARANITDVLSWDSEGNVKVKASADIPDNVASAIKKIRVSRSENGEPSLELEMHDKISVLRVLAKSAGLLEQHKADVNTPSVVGITMVGPEITQVREETKENEPR